MMHRFELHRDGDVGGTGIVAEGVVFKNGLGEDGPAAVHFASGPTVVLNGQGMEALADERSAHLVWLDEASNG